MKTLSAHSSPGRTRLRLEEWSQLRPGPTGNGKQLLGLSFASEADRALAAEMTRAGVVIITELRAGLSVETKSFIGRIAVGPLDLTIVPKISWERWLTLVTYALKLRGLVRADRLDVHTDSTDLQDLVILELVSEARDLLRRGLHREYVRRREMLSNPRGRIDFGRIARRGGVLEPAVPCKFTRRTDDSVINQTLLAGLMFASTRASNYGLRNDARRLANELGSRVSLHPLSNEMLSDASEALDRRTARYAAAIRLIELLREGKAITLDDSSDSSAIELPGFALDMNRIWQQLIARVLGEWSEAVDVREEFTLRKIFQSNPAYPLRRPVPRPRPDFAVFQNATLLTFLDAKYRDLWERPLPREMLYQLALYAMAQGGGVTAILYPSDSGAAVEQRVDIRDPLSDSIRAAIALRPVNLNALEALIDAPSTPNRTIARQQFSDSLISFQRNRVVRVN
ncbi:MAG: McrC family protein [Gemmatimonadaceae bacterium]